LIGPAAAAFLTALQWTKRGGSATLHCNVDHGAANRLLISSCSHRASNFHGSASAW
jgi:hypothetical protein